MHGMHPGSRGNVEEAQAAAASRNSKASAHKSSKQVCMGAQELRKALRWLLTASCSQREACKGFSCERKGFLREISPGAVTLRVRESIPSMAQVLKTL